jgi:polyferredoxin
MGGVERLDISWLCPIGTLSEGLWGMGQKLYYFFAAITPFAFSVIAILIVLSVIVKNFWCRYLCPYGALLGLGSLLSPMKIKRDAQTCIDCELCTKACPASIKVHTLHTVWSDECTSCLECVQVCPVQNTLEMRMHRTGHGCPPVFSLF